MRKVFAIIGMLAALSACGEKEEQKDVVMDLDEGEVVVMKPQFDIVYNEDIFAYDVNEAPSECSSKDAAVCAVDLAVKCTVNPKIGTCDAKKMPRFIFMEDESLQRPTKMSFKITKVKPIDMNTAEIYTASDCNGNWFGLCKGNIIYVVNNKNGAWVVKDIYAIENF